MDRIAGFRDHLHVLRRRVAPRGLAPRAIAIACCALAACFSPDIDDGVPCGPAGECPSGFSCSSGVCASAVTADAPRAADARATDATIDSVAFTDSQPPPPDARRFDAGPSGTLNVSFLGTGGGTVAANELSCTSDCPLIFGLGTVVTLTATPAGGSTFAGWGGACAGTAPCTLTIAAAPLSVEATFNVATQAVRLEIAVDGPGTVTSTPPGTSCGPGCAIYAPGTSVTLTPTASPGFSIIGWSGGPCDARGSQPCILTLDDDTAVTARFCRANRVVDAATGADLGNAGTCVAPFRTISRALSVATTGQLVQVRPGSYEAALGESFPLVVPDGVTVLGDEPQKGAATNPTRIHGGGVVTGSPGVRAAVVLGARAVLAGFLVVNDEAIGGAHGVVATRPSPGSAESAVVRNNSVQGCTSDGVLLERAPNARVLGNVIVQNGENGVRITGDAPGALLEDNIVVDNLYGVEVSAPADLGGGGAGSAGRNTLACNVEVDLVVTTPNAPVDAEDNGWDHVPPTSTTGCASGFDVCTGGATVGTAGAVQAPACI